MVQIIESNKPPSLSQRFSQAVGTGLEQGNKLMQEYNQKQAQEQQYNQENETYKQLTGRSLSKDPKIKQLEIEYALKGEQQGKQAEQKALELSGKAAQEKRQKLAPFQAGLQTINEMRKIGTKGNLGRGSSIFGIAGGETSKDRAQYSQLGKSLISLASTIPIRNKAEFEVLAHDLYDPSLSDKARDGILQSMENIIKRNMAQYMEGEESQAAQDAGSNFNQMTEQKPSLLSFHR